MLQHRSLASFVLPLLSALALIGPLDASAPREDAAELLIRATLAGEELGNDDVAGALVSAGRPGRMELLQLLADLDTKRDVDATRRRRLGRLRSQIDDLPERLANALVKVDGKHPNTALIASTGLDIVAMLGDSKDVDAAVTLAGPWPRKSQRPQPAHVEELQRALTAVLERDADAIDEIRQTYRRAAPEAAPALIDALHAVPRPETVRALVHCLGVQRELDGKVLNRLQGVASRTGFQLHVTELNMVRKYLSSEDAFQRGQAASCLGRLDDVDATEELIPLLSDKERSVVEAAHWSLRELSAMTMGPDIRRWQGWFQEQATAWDERSGEYLGALQVDDPAKLVEALNALSLMRLHRAEIAPVLAAMLSEPQRSEQALIHVCAAIESLRAESALPAVALALDHRDPKVRARAHRTLVVVTGLDLPAQASVWKRRLKSGRRPR